MSKGRVDDIDKLVSKKLKMRRLFLGLSQQDIAKKLDVSLQQMQKYEKGINRISSGKLYVLTKFLKVPTDYFFTKLDSSTSAITEQLYKMPSKKKAEKDSNTITEMEIIKLIKAYSSINNAKLRTKFIDIIKGVADNE